MRYRIPRNGVSDRGFYAVYVELFSLLTDLVFTLVLLHGHITITYKRQYRQDII